MTAGAIELRDGARLDVRAIEPSDRERLAGAFASLSPEARYRRFFGPVKELSPTQLDHLTRIDHRDHEALLALDGDGGIVAVARYVRTAPAEAEPAVVVGDAWQRRGVATALLGELARSARREGIERFRAPVLASNHDAISLLKHLGDAPQISREGREVEITIDLAADEQEPPRALLELLRGVAAGRLAPGRSLLARLRAWGSRG